MGEKSDNSSSSFDRIFYARRFVGRHELILGAEVRSPCSFEEVGRGSSARNSRRRYVRGIRFVESGVQRSCRLYLRNIRSLWKSSLRSGLSITAETHPGQYIDARDYTTNRRNPQWTASNQRIYESEKPSFLGLAIGDECPPGTAILEHWYRIPLNGFLS